MQTVLGKGHVGSFTQLKPREKRKKVWSCGYKGLAMVGYKGLAMVGFKGLAMVGFKGLAMVGVLWFHGLAATLACLLQPGYKHLA